ncbi:thiol peroxidase [Apilactobacillus timberlakei]|uniref:thiol peroxidase n=1 Tax=Apilactobacillus timberlakei TaxID=2008380 RepID=UPI001126003F|nr:thiol peroxidase [Apilactobacillus timberlakei]TPR22768.1 thiol peroxidase [Apilactobacillus timberlakei]
MELTFLGKKVNTDGEPINVGDTLPDFKVLNSNNETETNKDVLGKVTVISSVPDITSDVCSLETKKFNRKADDFSNVNFLTISKNTVDEQKDWCAAKGVKNIELLSDKDLSFGTATHTYVPDIDALARMIFVLDKDGKVVYRQVVPEIGTLPDFNEVVKSIEKLSNNVDD